jgi:ParB family chromosome partitioning protein
VIAGFTEVPCLIAAVNNVESSLIALVENLQRQDLDFMEEAEGLLRLIRNYGLSQEEAARRVGKSQSAVSNKLRLLKHPPEVISIIKEYHLTERHARALLRIPDTDARISAAADIGKKGLNVMQSERYIDALLSGSLKEKPITKIHAFYVLKDVRLFINTVERAMNIMNQAGISAQCDRKDTENEIQLSIHIPRSHAKAKAVLSAPAP